MPIRAVIAAFGEDPESAPYLGHQFTEIILRQPNDEDASNPREIAYDSRDKILEGVTGSDVAVVRRKIGQVELEIDFVDAEKKAAIERLYHDGRALYLCPNVGPHTRWSFPLQRSLKDFAGRKTMANARTGAVYFWDETEKVFRSWATTESAFDFNGRWTRYLRTQDGFENKASYPHPGSTAHGWSASVGSPVFTYTEDILSPVIQQRQVTNAKGVLMVHAPQGAGISTINHSSGPALSSTNSVIASVCIAWNGSINVWLVPNGGGSIIDILGAQYGDGTFRLLKLGGPNTDAATKYDIVISFNDSTTKKQAALIGPVMIANFDGTSATPDLEDWNTGSATSDSDDIAASDTLDHALIDFTMSFFFKWTDENAGICNVGSGDMLVIKTNFDAISIYTLGATSPQAFSNVQSVMGAAGGWAAGDWVHIVLRGSDTDGLCLFVNGVAHSENGNVEWEPGNYTQELIIGSSSGSYLASSGISHLRMDSVAWTDQEIIDHYDTYFQPKGRSIVEPLFGKSLEIEELSLTPRTTQPIQLVGSVVLRELGPDEDLAGMIQQEGSV